MQRIERLGCDLATYREEFYVKKIRGRQNAPRRKTKDSMYSRKINIFFQLKFYYYIQIIPFIDQYFE